jgi:hypothetical protein
MSEKINVIRETQSEIVYGFLPKIVITSREVLNEEERESLINELLMLIKFDHENVTFLVEPSQEDSLETEYTDPNRIPIEEFFDKRHSELQRAMVMPLDSKDTSGTETDEIAESSIAGIIMQAMSEFMRIPIEESMKDLENYDYYSKSILMSDIDPAYPYRDEVKRRLKSIFFSKIMTEIAIRINQLPQDKFDNIGRVNAILNPYTFAQDTEGLFSENASTYGAILNYFFEIIKKINGVETGELDEQFVEYQTLEDSSIFFNYILALKSLPNGSIGQDGKPDQGLLTRISSQSSIKDIIQVIGKFTLNERRSKERFTQDFLQRLEKFIADNNIEITIKNPSSLSEPYAVTKGCPMPIEFFRLLTKFNSFLDVSLEDILDDFIDN